MQFIDFLIEFLTYGGILIFAAQFIAYAWQRIDRSCAALTTATSNAVLQPAQREPQPVRAASPEALQRIDSEGRDGTELPGLWSCSDTIVPFKRPQKDYSDLALIRLAKSLAKQGRYDSKALKWSFNRKLSKPVRAELMQMALKGA